MKSYENCKCSEWIKCLETKCNELQAKCNELQDDLKRMTKMRDDLAKIANKFRSERDTLLNLKERLF